jgi:HPt (histidine-containing phosphotransfer) domain-containing protein
MFLDYLSWIKILGNINAGLPHHVYRLFDKAGGLLYIGCSFQPVARREQHNIKPWYEEIASMTSEEFPNLAAARAAEAKAIETESPPHNTAHQKKKQATARQVREGERLAESLSRRMEKRIRCPKCGSPKEYKPGVAYCPACITKYRLEWNAAHGRPPHPRLVSNLCKCGQPKYVAKSGKVDHAYCNACKRLAAARHRNRSHDVTTS